MSRDEWVRETTIRAIERYNRYRAPEAVAELLEVSGTEVRILFRGTFCKTCGINDWVEDFKYELEDLGVEAELVDILEPVNPEEEFRIGVFRVNRRFL